MNRKITIVIFIAFCGLLCGACKKEQKPAAEPAAPAYFRVDPATAAAITGKAMAPGKKPVRKRIDMGNDPVCSGMHATGMLDEEVAVDAAGNLANVFVYVKQGLEDKKFEPPAEPKVIDQKGCWFLPRVWGVQTGQVYKVTNSDPLTHNIHPMPQNNRDWNQSQPPGAEPFVRKFMFPEVMIKVKCNIHGWMHSWIGVVPHPYYAVTGADGAFSLPNLPPGKYTLEAWHESLGRLEQAVDVGPAAKSEIVFTFNR